jgi:hypothetical protein
MFHLQPSDARLVSLAVVYHLGRPGSETDPDTLQPHQLGLGPVRDALEAQRELLGDAAEAAHPIALELSPYQLSRLGTALHGTVNELKQFGMAGGRSAVPGFAEAFARLFPAVAGDAEPGGDPGPGAAALDLVAEAVMLRRRLDAAVRAAEQQVAAAREAQSSAGAEVGTAPRWRRLARGAARPWHRLVRR